MYKKFLLKCRIRHEDDWFEEYSDTTLDFDTKEEMTNFIKNGTEYTDPKDIEVECAFELNKIDIELYKDNLKWRTLI